MKRFPAVLLMFPALLLCAAVLVAAQIKPPTLGDEEPARLPNGKLQTEEIARAEFQNSLKDSARLLELSEELKVELEKNDRHIVSLAAVKKCEEIEKLAKRIRGRLVRR